MNQISLFATVAYLIGLAVTPCWVNADDPWLTFRGGEGPGKGKHVVLIAADQEYRSEQSLPMLAGVLSQRHGFDCTVLFSVNEKGEVDPTLPAPFKKEDKRKYHKIPGLEKLADADCVIWLSRFMQLPDDQLKHFHDYFDSGKPLIALRTANHGFWRGTRYFKDGKQVSLREMLGGSFMGHHGGWHRESTRGEIVKENKSHPILKGVSDIWGPSDVYRCHNEKSPMPEGCKTLVLGQPLIDLNEDSKPNIRKQPLPIAWTKTWKGNQGKESKIFHFTMGSAKDFENEGVRRMTVNAVYWGLGLDASIDPNRSVEPIGNYQPRKSGFNYEKLGVKPCLVSELAPKEETPLPNIIIIYADDLGFGDLSCYNSKCAYKTPRLDQMASEGIRFTDAHSPSTICSPSRYGLYSGQQIFRSTGRGGGAFEGPGGPSYLKPGTLTIAQMLKSKGYRTGVFGKWHVGLTWVGKDGKRLGGGFKNSLLIDYEKSTPLIDGPNARGFDESFVTPNCPTTDPLYVYIENGNVPVPATMRHKRNTLPNPGGKWRWDNDEGWKAEGYKFVDADRLFYEKTKSFISKHVKANPKQPFFAVLSTQIAHAPVLPGPDFRGKTKAGARGDFVFQLDAIVGQTLDLVKELGIDDNTLILFNADNGAETLHVHWMRQDHDHDASGGWRGMKRDGWEGGHRVPFIARWPGRIPAGAVSKQMTNTTDIFATLASVVGYELKEKDARDSFDMLPVMLGTQDESRSVRPHLLTQSFRGEFQIRQGKWKYLDHRGSGGNNYEKGMMKGYQLEEKAPDADGQLYDLAKDPGETNNLYFDNEAKRKELQALLKNLKQSGRSAPKVRKPIGIENIPRIHE